MKRYCLNKENIPSSNPGKRKKKILLEKRLIQGDNEEEKQEFEFEGNTSRCDNGLDELRRGCMKFLPVIILKSDL